MRPTRKNPQRAVTLLFTLSVAVVMFCLGATLSRTYYKVVQAPEGPRGMPHVIYNFHKSSNAPLPQHDQESEHHGDGVTTTNEVNNNNNRVSTSVAPSIKNTAVVVMDTSVVSGDGERDCDASVRSAFKAYHQFALRGEDLRSQYGTLKIAAFSRLWVPPIHGTGGMQFHALHLYSQLAARGHYVHVFVSGPPHGTLKKLYLRVNPATLHVEDEADTSKATLIVEQVASDKNAEYSETWYANCLVAFLRVNKTIGGFHVAHSESWAGVPNTYQIGLQMLVTWHGSMLDWFRNEMNLIVHNFRMKGKMPSGTLASRMSNLGSSVAFETYMLLSVPHHVVISDSAAKDLKEMNLIDPDAIHLIYNGVNPQNFKPADNRDAVRHAYLTQHQVNPEHFIVGCGGRLDGIKGHLQLSKAMRIVLAKYKNVTLLVAGSGAEGSRYEAMKSDQLSVVMLGMLPQTALAQFYQSLDVFIDPFYQHHGLNTVMLEATLSGVPIIATRLASAQTTAPCSGFGRTFALGNVQELAEQVVYMMRHPAERARIGQNVRERAIHLFSSEIMAGSYESLFYKVMRDPTPLVQLTGKVVCRHTYPAMCYREPTTQVSSPS